MNANHFVPYVALRSATTGGFVDSAECSAAARGTTAVIRAYSLPTSAFTLLRRSSTRRPFCRSIQYAKPASNAAIGASSINVSNPAS